MNTLVIGAIGLGIGVVVGCAAGLWLGARTSPVSGVAFDPARPTFPTTAGDNLNGRQVRFPEGIDAPYAVLLVAFYQPQQTQVNTWLDAAKEIVRDHANVEYYELPTISSNWGVARSWIDNGMRSGIPDFADRERTVTLYTDVDQFCALAGIEDKQRIWVGVVDRAGRVYWSVRGPATPEALKELRSKVREVAASTGT
ncbi:MAG: hypothetical protein ACKVW3_04575 [Phycisphaerales bacterium]